MKDIKISMLIADTQTLTVKTGGVEVGCDVFVDLTHRI